MTDEETTAALVRLADDWKLLAELVQRFAERGQPFGPVLVCLRAAEQALSDQMSAAVAATGFFLSPEAK